MRSAAIACEGFSRDVATANRFAEIADRMAEYVWRRLGERIRATRERVGFTQAQLGAKVGLSAARISRYETASGYIALDLLFKLARAMNVRFADLINIEEETIPEPHAPPTAPQVVRPTTRVRDEQELLESYRKLSPHMQAVLRLFASESLKVDSRSRFYDPTGKRAADAEDDAGNGSTGDV